MNSQEIKLALMEYFRFKRNYICCSEFYLYSGRSDVVAYDYKNNLIDIEINNRFNKKNIFDYSENQL